VIAATNRKLEELAAAGKFREDLYFRLKVLEIDVPPLRERKEDIPHLTQYLLEKINRELHRHVSKVPDVTMERLIRYDWPGNVRELENVLTQAVLRSQGQMLALDFWSERPISSEKREMKTLAEMEKEHIEWVLAEVGGHLGKACDILGITRPTLRKKIEDYEIKLET
jgi:transcriptional regulator with PAS, ATPase and Fis domain